LGFICKIVCTKFIKISHNLLSISTFYLFQQTLNIFELDWKTVSISSAKLFFDLRKKVVTIKKSTDCLIAQIAIDKNALLVHNDSDFDFIAQNSELRVYV
jgi:predicted nucleic acid-binding protein